MVRPYVWVLITLPTLLPAYSLAQSMPDSTIVEVRPVNGLLAGGEKVEIALIGVSLATIGGSVDVSVRGESAQVVECRSVAIDAVTVCALLPVIHAGDAVLRVSWTAGSVSRTISLEAPRPVELHVSSELGPAGLLVRVDLRGFDGPASVELRSPGGTVLRVGTSLDSVAPVSTSVAFGPFGERIWPPGSYQLDLVHGSRVRATSTFGIALNGVFSTSSIPSRSTQVKWKRSIYAPALADTRRALVIAAREARPEIDEQDWALIERLASQCEEPNPLESARDQDALARAVDLLIRARASYALQRERYAFVPDESLEARFEILSSIAAQIIVHWFPTLNAGRLEGVRLLRCTDIGVFVESMEAVRNNPVLRGF